MDDLFRGLKDGRLLYSSNCLDHSMFFSLVDHVNTVMLYTGRDDIAGTPIFEGDFVYEFKKTKKELGTILFRLSWDRKQMGFLLRYFIKNNPNKPVETFDYPARYKNFKIVGNIHENPELEKKWRLDEMPKV